MTGKSLGDYLLIRELGQGSFGSLFLAEHRFLKRPFALKILPTEIVADSRFLERFEREVTALYQLDHPHIVKVHNVSCFENSYFLATDCILQGEEMARNLCRTAFNTVVYEIHDYGIGLHDINGDVVAVLLAAVDGEGVGGEGGGGGVEGAEGIDGDGACDREWGGGLEGEGVGVGGVADG